MKPLHILLALFALSPTAAFAQPAPLPPGYYEGMTTVAVIEPASAEDVQSFLANEGIDALIEGSVVYGVSVPPEDAARARDLLLEDAERRGYWLQTNP